MTGGLFPSETPSKAGDHVGTLQLQYLYLCNPSENIPLGPLKLSTGQIPDECPSLRQSCELQHATAKTSMLQQTTVGPMTWLPRRRRCASLVTQMQGLTRGFQLHRQV